MIWWVLLVWSTVGLVVWYGHLSVRPQKIEAASTRWLLWSTLVAGPFVWALLVGSAVAWLCSKD